MFSTIAGQSKKTTASSATKKNVPNGLKRRARSIYEELKALYPYAHAELDFENPYQLLIATVLSAQTTDIRVNQVTPLLFREYPDPTALSQARISDVENIIRTLGFYRAKAENVVKLSAMIIDDFDGKVPQTQKELVRLPGVGKKTANAVLGNAFNIPGLTVDTHFIRLANLWEWVNTKDPVRIEQEVATLFNRNDWTMLSHVIIFHGRRMCIARKPLCGICPIAQFCPSSGSGETNPRKAAELLRFETAPGMAYAPEIYEIRTAPEPPEGAIKVADNIVVFFPAWRQPPAKPENLDLTNKMYGSSHAPGGGKRVLRPKG